MGLGHRTVADNPPDEEDQSGHRGGREPERRGEAETTGEYATDKGPDGHTAEPEQQYRVRTVHGRHKQASVEPVDQGAAY